MGARTRSTDTVTILLLLRAPPRAAPGCVGEHGPTLVYACERVGSRCLSIETLAPYRPVVGQLLIGCPDALNRHRDNITAPPSALSRASVRRFQSILRRRRSAPALSGAPKSFRQRVYILKHCLLRSQWNDTYVTNILLRQHAAHVHAPRAVDKSNFTCKIFPAADCGRLSGWLSISSLGPARAVPGTS